MSEYLKERVDNWGNFVRWKHIPWFWSYFIQWDLYDWIFDFATMCWVTCYQAYLNSLILIFIYWKSSENKNKLTKSNKNPKNPKIPKFKISTNQNIHNTQPTHHTPTQKIRHFATQFFTPIKLFTHAPCSSSSSPCPFIDNYFFSTLHSFYLIYLSLINLSGYF